MVKIKITVVKKIHNKDMSGDKSPVEFTSNPVCDKVELGQEFISEGGSCP